MVNKNSCLSSNVCHQGFWYCAGANTLLQNLHLSAYGRKNTQFPLVVNYQLAAEIVSPRAVMCQQYFVMGCGR